LAYNTAEFKFIIFIKFLLILFFSDKNFENGAAPQFFKKFVGFFRYNIFFHFSRVLQGAQYIKKIQFNILQFDLIESNFPLYVE